MQSWLAKRAAKRARRMSAALA
jgi:hypothetical protein